MKRAWSTSRIPATAGFQARTDSLIPGWESSSRGIAGSYKTIARRPGSVAEAVAWSRDRQSRRRGTAGRTHRVLVRELRDTGAEQRAARSEEHTSELQSHSDLVCRLLLEKK